MPAPHSRRRAPNHGPRARTHTPRNMGIDCVTSAAATVAWHRPGGSAIIPKGASCTKIDRAVYALPSRRNADCWSCLHVCACAPPAHPAQHCGPPAQPAPTPSPCRSRPLSHLTMPSFFAVEPWSRAGSSGKSVQQVRGSPFFFPTTAAEFPGEQQSASRKTSRAVASPASLIAAREAAVSP